MPKRLREILALESNDDVPADAFEALDPPAKRRVAELTIVREFPVVANANYLANSDMDIGDVDDGYVWGEHEIGVDVRLDGLDADTQLVGYEIVTLDGMTLSKRDASRLDDLPGVDFEPDGDELLGYVEGFRDRDYD